MKPKSLGLLLAFGFLVAPLFATESTGPNPGNLAPTGSDSVSLYTGAFTYTYPIVVPPGRHGIQPDLQLIYNSQANNGWLGIGWDLSIGSIQRSTKNGVPTYNDSVDTFTFTFQGQSQNLVPVGTGNDSGTGYGTYTEYRAQIESGFIRFRYYAGSPGWWEARTKDGKIYQFTSLLANKSNIPFYWGLQTVTDPLGNTMLITYATGGSNQYSHVSGYGGTFSFIPDHIDYTGNSTTGLKPSFTVQFGFQSRPDQISSGISGAGMQQLNALLSSISVYPYHNENVTPYRQYAFSYTTNSAGSSLLKTITVTGRDGQSTLPPTVFGYQDTTGSLPLVQMSPSKISANDPRYMGDASAGDFNGDGLADLYYHPYEGGNQDINHYVGISNGNGAFAFSSWANQFVDRAAVADYNNDSKSDVLGYHSTYSAFTYQDYVGSSNGNSLNFTTWTPVRNITGPRYLIGVGDVNGDGLPDNIYREPGNGITVELNQGNNSFGPDISWVPENSLVCGENNCTYVVGDFNGDGLMDIAYLYQNDGYFRIGLSNGSNAFNLTTVTSQSFNWRDSSNIRVGDFNGDGLSDLLVWDDGSAGRQIWVGLSNGQIPIFSSWGTYSTNSPSQMAVGDFNGDGLSDVLYYNGGSGNSQGVMVGVSNGAGFTWGNWGAWSSYSSFAANNPNKIQFLPADYNGDGKIDIALINDTLQTWAAYSQGAPISLLNRVTNPLGGTVNVLYQVYKSGNASALPFPVNVVASVSSTDGMGSLPVVSSYTYSGGYYDKSVLKQRDFLGFAQVTTTDALGNYTVTDFYQNNYPSSVPNPGNGINVFKGKICEQDHYDNSGNLLSKTVNTYNYSSPFQGVYFPYLAQTDNYMGTKDGTVQYQYDGFGNLTQEYDLADGNDAKTISTDYSQSGYSSSMLPYLVGYPIHKKIVDANGNTASEVWFTYDGNTSYTQYPTAGLVTKTDTRMINGTGNDPIVTMAYDAYGNMTDDYDALWNATSGAKGDHIKKSYETTYEQYLSTSTQGVGSLNLTDTYTFDPVTGQMLTHTDVNNQKTQYQYDVFGRLSTVIGPMDSSTYPTLTYQYTIATSNGVATPPHIVASTARVIASSTNTLTSYSFIDGLGRTRETLSPEINTTQIVSNVATYDARGNVSQSYLPWTNTSVSTSWVNLPSNQPYATTHYDPLGRVTEVDNPDGTKIQKSYANWTETDTDANGNSKNYDKDAYGRIIEVDEINGAQTYITTYGYDTLNNLTQITNSLSQISIMKYDSLSDKTSITDPQMGYWQYKYDANGNLQNQTDAKGNVIQMTYDVLNRILTKNYPDGTKLTYQYDVGNYAKGRLSKVTDLSGTQSFTYDNLGRVLSKTRTIGGTAYVTSMAYDDMGRETSVTYPNKNVVNSHYNGSMLTSVQAAGSATPYASLTYDNNAIGKLGTVSYGNGVTATYTYDTTHESLRLTNLASNTSSNQVLQNFGYSYDNVGNILQITDAVGGNQNFQYDNLNRLLTANGPYGAKTYQYDSFGDFLSNADTTEGSWGFDDTSGITSLQGSVILSNGRIGDGLYFNGNSVAQLNNSQNLSPTLAISVGLWVRPLSQGTTGYILSKQGSYGFSVYLPTATLTNAYPSGNLYAQLTLASGQQTITVPNVMNYNIWSYVVMTYDGTTIKVYVNGQLKAQQAASGLIMQTPYTVQMGSGFQGFIDEVTIDPRALSAQDVLSRFQSAPPMPPSQPLTPMPVQSGLVSGQLHSFYGFQFAAWDIEGDPIKYQIDWGTGPYQLTGYVPSGTVVVASQSWTTQGTYSIRVMAMSLPAGTTTPMSSPWSPVFNIYITSAIVTQMGNIPLIGAEGGIAQSVTSSAGIVNTAGEWMVSKSSSSNYWTYFGFQGPVADTSTWWGMALGSLGTGGADPTPPSKLPVSLLVSLSTQTTPLTSQQMATVAQGLNQNGYTQATDANGNQILAGNRWIQYDFENRPALIITPDGTTTSFVYDFEGNRVEKTINQGGQTETDTYIGQIYEYDVSSTINKTIQYITAGSLRVAMLTNGALTYFLPDHLGSTNILMDGNQNQVRYNGYTPFGDLATTNGTQDSDYKFTGQRLDGNTGLYYYGARYYDSELGRFITPDTVVQNPYDPQTLNRFTYCRNNPVRLIDPSGHSWWSQLAGAVAGAVTTVFTGNPALGYSVYNGLNSTLEAASDGGNWEMTLDVSVMSAAFAYGGGEAGGNFGPIGQAMGSNVAGAAVAADMTGGNVGKAAGIGALTGLISSGGVPYIGDFGATVLAGSVGSGLSGNGWGAGAANAAEYMAAYDYVSGVILQNSNNFTDPSSVDHSGDKTYIVTSPMGASNDNPNGNLLGRLGFRHTALLQGTNSYEYETDGTVHVFDADDPNSRSIMNRPNLRISELNVNVQLTTSYGGIYLPGLQDCHNYVAAMLHASGQSTLPAGLGLSP